MKPDRTQELIGRHEEMLEYELGNYERGQSAGSYDASFAALARAGYHAAILSALLARRRDQ